ncbi:MAG: pyridoxamine 5'-phosphate oxidase family protein [Alphaproteobacteria bacterium]|nr:pyridoxamine 5'-phosphate oxidase family protein [Alphaproteobacteria bacterium]
MGVVSNIEQLRSIYNYSKGRAALKVINSLEKHSKNFINLSPFVVISSKGKNGHADVSPRGDSVGFVKIQDDKTIIIPDRSGNNRLDTLENIIFDPSVGTLFFIPGINTVLRINGNAFIEDSLEIRAQFEINNNIPKTCIIINIEEIFMHCSKALMRSSFWDHSKYLSQTDFPTISKIINDQLNSEDDEQNHQQEDKRYKKQIIEFG